MSKVNAKVNNKNKKDGIYIIPGLTNCVIHVDGPDEDIKKFFTMVATNEMYSRTARGIVKRELKNRKLGTFCTKAAIESLIIINEKYENILTTTEDEVNYYNAPHSYNITQTANKFTGTELLFFVDLLDYKVPKDAIEDMKNILACYALEFPELEIWFGTDTVSRHTLTNEKIIMSQLISDFVHDGKKTRNQCKPEVPYTAVYSDNSIKFGMTFKVINKDYVNIIQDKLYATYHKKRKTFTL